MGQERGRTININASLVVQYLITRRLAVANQWRRNKRRSNEGTTYGTIVTVSCMPEFDP